MKRNKIPQDAMSVQIDALTKPAPTPYRVFLKETYSGGVDVWMEDNKGFKQIVAAIEYVPYHDTWFIRTIGNSIIPTENNIA